ncbi:MAG: hypothetical protein U0O22_09310 [Acutalibacteraceae bacterium]
MWVNSNNNAEKVTITDSKNGLVNATGGVPFVGAKVVVPYGVVSIPVQGANAVMLDVNGQPVCLGVLQGDSTLEMGEIMLYSKGGASIVLKNNGKVYINGKEVT